MSSDNIFTKKKHHSYIKTYFSSNTDILSNILIDSLPTYQQRQKEPFKIVHVIVPNFGMRRYLELKIAEKLGVCSNINIEFSGQFLARCYDLVLKNKNNKNHLDINYLTFCILSFWQKYNNGLPDIFANTPLPNLLNQYSTEKQKYIFAKQVAQLFKKYLNERPQLINNWQRGANFLHTGNIHERWQMLLFNNLHLGYFSSNKLQQSFHKSLDKENNKIPELHIFGFHAIPPVQLEDFAVMSRHSDVNAYIFNPSVIFWQDIVPESIKIEKSITAESEAKLITTGNPLLASWGQASKFLIEQLNESKESPINADELLRESYTIESISVLTWVKNNIIDWNKNNNYIQLKNLADSEISNNNFSIKIHVTASPRREIEILYDNLCKLFVDDKLNPSDILVMMPNLRDYAPHIQAVFGADPNRKIPFSLANQIAAEADPDTQAYLSLLELIKSNFSSQSLFNVISENSIKEKFDLSATDIKTINYWLIKDKFANNYQDDSNGRSSSLEKLLDSLLIAYIGGDDCHVKLRNTIRFSLNDYRKTQQQSLSKFCQLLSCLSDFSKITQKSFSLSKWKDIYIDLANMFLGDMNQLTPRIQRWYDSILSGCDHQDNIASEIFSFDVINLDITELLENEDLHGPFLSGGVSFCAMVPMRSIPAKMICLLGLNQDFPNIKAKNPIDLCQSKPLWSDRNPNKEQKYFFLETLMAVQESLYISYVGQDEKTGQEIPASIIVDELMGFINSHCPNYIKSATNIYPLQGFLNKREPTYQSIYKEPIDKKSVFEQNHNKREIHDIFAMPRQIKSRLIADTIYEPLPFYIKQNLNASMIDIPSDTLAEHEFISLDNGLDNWCYKNIMLSSDILNEDVIPRLSRKNILPPENISSPLLADTKKHVAPLFEKLQKFIKSNSSTKLKFINYQYNDKTICLLLDGINYSDIGNWQYSLSSVNIKKMLQIWVNHVLLNNISGLNCYESTLLSIERTDVKETILKGFKDISKAQESLKQILDLFSIILENPYPIILDDGKRNKEILNYKEKDYPIYPSLSKVVNNLEYENIQILLSNINSTLHEYMDVRGHN